ncbi:hypothetical protein [Enterovirga sp.]|uniref:hypothetical protein n=1 Tax=Enterovirga sp. TaxID=2026350 RepID=UPI002B8E53E4|nr:hypothetical protein [Enterovirga sp.]HMO29872.1 hypothetical protein [Enterovirga sp.]
MLSSLALSRPARALRAGLLTASLCVAAPALCAPPAFAQGVSHVAGTGIGLAPPKGMRPSKTFSGFESPETGASILVGELPAEAYPAILATFTPEGLASSGLQAAGPAIDWKVAGGEGGRLIRGRQTAYGTVFRKWVLLAKGPANTVMITVQVPDAKSAALPDAAVEGALKTISLKAPPSLEEQVSSLPFRIGNRAGFRLVRVISGSGLLLTEGPRDAIPDASQPVVIVASAVGAVGAHDKAEREALAERAFSSIAGVSDVSVASRSMTDKDGASWSRIEGRGTYRASQEAVSTLQLMRFDKTGYIRIVAIASSLDRDKIVPRVEALAASIAPR